MLRRSLSGLDVSSSLGEILLNWFVIPRIILLSGIFVGSGISEIALIFAGTGLTLVASVPHGHGLETLLGSSKIQI